MKCPLCNTRKARRQCPAKSALICPVCCATKREIEIDCPLSCAYLREGYTYARQKTPLEQRARGVQAERQFDRSFLIANEAFLTQLWQWIWEGYLSAPQLHDAEIIAAITALEKTYQTLDKGLYYESRPDSGLEQLLFQKLKEAIDAKIQSPDLAEKHLKLSTVIDCLIFLQQMIHLRTSGRPLSRGFLLQLQETFSSLPSQAASTPHVVLS